MISNFLNISCHPVQHIIKKFREHGTTENISKIGRPPLNNDRNGRRKKSEENAPELLKDWESSVPAHGSSSKKAALVRKKFVRKLALN